MRASTLLSLPALLGAAQAISLVKYNGKIGEAYDDSNYVAADKSIYAIDEEGFDTAAHPSYVIPAPNGHMLISGDSFGDGEGRGWANYFDDKANLQWAWQSKSKEFDAILGAAVGSDGTCFLGGMRSVSKRWELLLVALDSKGNEKWTSTLPLSSSNALKNSTGSPQADNWDVIYWMDVDLQKELLVMGGVVDHPAGADGIAWKSGGLMPDPGGKPFVAAIPFSKLNSAPTVDDIATSYFFNKGDEVTTVVSFRVDQGKGVVALLPSIDGGGSVAKLTYDDNSKFSKAWSTPLSVQNQATDIAIVSDKGTTAYVVSYSLNPGGKVEAFAADGSSLWARDYNVKDVYPTAGKRNWCQECWSMATQGGEVMLSCGVSELKAFDKNCDHGTWRSFLVTFPFSQPTNTSYHLFHGDPDENFAVEYASFGADGRLLCAIDADSGSSIVRLLR